MKRRRNVMTYYKAIRWLAQNDDCDWLVDRGPMSVAASAVADIFDRSDEELVADLARDLKHLYPATYADLAVPSLTPA